MASPSSPLKIGPDDEPDGAPLTSWYTQGVTDGFGDRLLMFDNAATGPVELLRVRHEFAVVPGFESALRQRFSALTSFVHPGFAQARVVNHLDNGGGLTVAASHVTGTRLSALFEASRPLPGMHPGAVREVFGDLVASINDLHRCGAGIAHGALSADRVILTFDRRLVVTDYIFGAALEQLNLPAARLWSDFGLVSDASTSRVHLDTRGDLTQLGLLMLCLVLGRRVTPEEYPQGMTRLLDEFAVAANRRAPDLTAPMSAWLEQSLDPSGFESVAEASHALSAFPPRPHYLDLHAPEPKALAPAAPRHTAVASPAAPPTPDTTGLERSAEPPVALAAPVPEPVELAPSSMPASADPAPEFVAEPTVDVAGELAAGSEERVDQEHAVEEYVETLAPAADDDVRPVEPAAALLPPDSDDDPVDHLVDHVTDNGADLDTRGAQAFADEAAAPLVLAAPLVDATVSLEATETEPTPVDHTLDADTPVALEWSAADDSTDAGVAPLEQPSAERDYERELAALIDAMAAEPDGQPALQPTPVETRALASAPDTATSEPDFADIDLRYSAPLRRPDSLSPSVTTRLDALDGPPLPHSSLLLRPDTETPAPAVSSLGSLLRVPPPDAPPPALTVPESGRDGATTDEPVQFIKLTSRLRSAPEPPPAITTLQRPAPANTRPEPFAWAQPALPPEGDETAVDTTSPRSPLVWWIVAALVTLVVGQGALIVRLSSRPTTTRVHIESAAPGDSVVIDGKTVGVTPLDVPLDSADAVVQIVPRAGRAEGTAPAAADRAPDAATLAATAKAAFEAIQQPDVATGRIAGIRVVAPIPLEVMDGKEYLGSTARGPIYTTPGIHDLDFVNNTVGFRATQRVQAVSGSMSPVQVTPPQGTVNVTTQPPAQVWVDGRFVGNSPVANLSLTLGEHEFVLRHPTLGERRHKAVVLNRQTTRVSVSFNP